MKRLLPGAVLALFVGTAVAQQVHYVSGIASNATNGCIWVVQQDQTPPDRKLCDPDFLTGFGLMQTNPNTVDGNFGSGTAVDRHNAMPSCSDGAGWLVYNAGIACGGRSGALDSTASNPQNVSTASTSFVMAGIGQQSAGFQINLNPKAGGNYTVVIRGGLWSNLANNGAQAQLCWGTGTAPAAGAAVPVGATCFGNIARTVQSTNGSRYPFRVTGYATVSGCPCWVDLKIEAVTGGTASGNSLVAMAYERS